MSNLAFFAAGLIATPVVVVGALVAMEELAPGLEVHCCRCGYSTGDRKTTRQIVARVRWQWHWNAGHLRGRR